MGRVFSRFVKERPVWAMLTVVSIVFSCWVYGALAHPRPLPVQMVPVVPQPPTDAELRAYYNALVEHPSITFLRFYWTILGLCILGAFQALEMVVWLLEFICNSIGRFLLYAFRKLTKRTTMASAAVLLVLFASMPKPANAQLGGGVFVCPTCSQEPTQLANFAKLVVQIANQVQAIGIALQTYQQIMVAGATLSNMQWTNARQDLANIAGIIQVGQGLTYTLAGVDRVFQQRYPGLNLPNLPWMTQYQSWSQGSLDTIQGSLAGQNMAYLQLQTDELYRDYLRAQNEGAIGEMQAVQLGNQISIELLNSISKMRQATMTNNMSSQIYQGYQIQKEAATQAIESAFFAPNPAGRDGIGFQ